MRTIFLKTLFLLISLTTSVIQSHQSALQPPSYNYDDEQRRSDFLVTQPPAYDSQEQHPLLARYEDQTSLRWACLKKWGCFPVRYCGTFFDICSDPLCLPPPCCCPVVAVVACYYTCKGERLS